MLTEKQKENLNAGDKCPECKKGKIALMDALISCAEKDQEPYESGKEEGDCEMIELNDNINISIYACDNCGEIVSRCFQDDYPKPIQIKELEKLKEIERKLTLFRDDLSGYRQFIERNIKQSKELVAWEEFHKELIETLESLDYATDTEKEIEGLRLKITNIIKMAKPNTH